MRKIHFLAVLSLFLLVPASIICAQTVSITGTVSMQQDTRNVQINSPKGKLKVFLPADLSNPEPATIMLSGTVTVEPAGKTEKEIQRNKKELQEMILTVAGIAVPLSAASNSFQIPVAPRTYNPVSVQVSGNNQQPFGLTLKQPTMSIPASNQPLRTGQPTLFTDQALYLKNGYIPVYTANNASCLFMPADKFFIKDASGKVIEATRLAGSPTQSILEVPPNVKSGPVEIIRQGSGFTDQLKTYVAELSLHTPNANLRSGQVSTVSAQINLNTTEQDEALVRPLHIEVQNLAPQVVEMVGGNRQVFRFPSQLNSPDPADWQITRTLVGINPGSFSISATLHPSTQISRHAPHTQKNVLKTPEEFNEWSEAVKNFLTEKLKSSTDEMERELLNNISNALPHCTSFDELEMCKTLASNLLRFAGKSLSDMNNDVPAFAAYKAEAARLINQSPGDDFIHPDIIAQGLRYIQLATEDQENPELEKSINDAYAASVSAEKNYTSDQLFALQQAVKKVNASAVVQQLAATLKPLKPSAWRESKTFAGYLDPVEKTLYVNDVSRETILNSLKAVPAGVNRYRINAVNANLQAASIEITIRPLLMMPSSIYSGDWWAEYLIENYIKKDTTRGKIITTHKDSATWYVFYENAKCTQSEYQKGQTFGCAPQTNWDNTEKKDKPTGFYSKSVINPTATCKKGDKFCTEIYVISSIEYIYKDANCNQLIKTIENWHFSCL